MNKKLVPNEARIQGTIVNVESHKKATIINVDTGNSTISTVAFNRTMREAAAFKVGDTVIIDAVVESNNATNGFPSCSLVIRRIAFGEHNRTQPQASFRFAGRPIRVQRVNESRATALILMNDGVHRNIVRVYFEGSKAKVDEFCELSAKDFLFIHGKFTDGGLPYISSWRSPQKH